MSGPSVSATPSTQTNAAPPPRGAAPADGTPAERMIAAATGSNGSVDTKALANMVADAARTNASPMIIKLLLQILPLASACPL
jgi:hypothetical protein